MTDKRQYMRTPFKATVKLLLSEKGEVQLTMEDMSNGGVFLLTENIEPPPLGSIVKVQVQGMMADAPLISAKVVRVTREGIGLQFIDS